MKNPKDRECAKELEKLLKKYNCMLNVEFRINSAKETSFLVSVVPKEVLD